MLSSVQLLSVAWLFCAFATSVRAAETVEDAARIARNLVEHASNAIGTMATVYPSDHPELPGQPFSLQEYYASCHQNGSLTLLVMPISRHSQNIFLSPVHAASMSVWSEQPAASKARVSLMGTVTVFRDIAAAPDREAIQACYIETHPDARWWVPGPREPHVAYWARFDIQSIYFVGGFGSSHYIGYIPTELYAAATTGRSVAGRLMVQRDGGVDA